MSGWQLKNKTCIVGIGETQFMRWGRSTRSSFDLACEAISKAVADAGLNIHDIDGLVTYALDQNHVAKMATGLGLPELRYATFWPGGGGGTAAVIMDAAMAVHCGAANYVVCYRSLCQGQERRFGQAKPMDVATGEAAFTTPYGLVSPAQRLGLQVKRYMHEYHITERHLAAVALACNKHAQRNPRALMNGKPLTLETYLSSRMIVDPLRLYDCCLESDGACAIVVTTLERARSLKKKPVSILAACQGAGARQGEAPGDVNREGYLTANFYKMASDLYKRAEVTPKDVDVAQIYESCTGMVLMALEDFGFCGRGEAGRFVETGALEWPAGRLPINTSGGNLAEGYIHGLELVNEGVRQMRGDSTSQVQDAKICLVAGGSGAHLVSCMLLGRE